MTIKISDALANKMFDTNSLDALLNGGFISIYAGTVPTTADAALDVTAGTGVHTLLAKITSDAVAADTGSTGLNFEAAAASRAIVKATAETWHAKVFFRGKYSDPGDSPLTATFYRFHTVADITGDCGGSQAGTSTTYRIQGTVGTSGADLNLTSVSLTENGTNTVGVSTYELRFDA